MRCWSRVHCAADVAPVKTAPDWIYGRTTAVLSELMIDTACTVDKGEAVVETVTVVLVASDLEFPGCPDELEGNPVGCPDSYTISMADADIAIMELFVSTPACPNKPTPAVSDPFPDDNSETKVCVTGQTVVTAGDVIRTGSDCDDTGGENSRHNESRTSLFDSLCGWIRNPFSRRTVGDGKRARSDGGGQRLDDEDLHFTDTLLEECKDEPTENGNALELLTYAEAAELKIDEERVIELGIELDKTTTEDKRTEVEHRREG
ncbi:hypothetical protein BGW36DRAFT_429903 [Talaromyces proteolyticus]|uniref:Uncharacterized protein n=1 Tax=Talaromyces proteolyticus TaxID=1131652 RepID=A0AAD4KPM5_9EURO|nr:uncharacterized protein BGW36DRAFT_429903 [Talaromyces proteolyticus]KAH8693873.1 hypothetical protein BGW36DRAFT_429903 [Talaromyces proteolyticus]